MLVHLLFSQISHDAGLTVRGPLNGVSDDPIEVGVDSSLVHFDNLLIKTLLPSSDDFFSVPATCFFSLSVPSLFLGLFHLLLYLFLLGDSY